jgi:hypothetical protein
MAKADGGKAEQAGAPKGETPGEAELKTLGFRRFRGCEALGSEERKGKEKREMIFSWAASRESLESRKPRRASRS